MGLEAGVPFRVSSTVGLRSITAADPAPLAGWAAGQTVELRPAGMVLEMGMAGTPVKKLVGWTLAGMAGAVMVTVALRPDGLAPQIHVPAP